MSLATKSWLIEGGTPIDDVMRALHIDKFPRSGNYKTINGFMSLCYTKSQNAPILPDMLATSLGCVDIDN
ncbi:MAG: hypothetical protein GPOALKHO_001488 [Sodalis sp.]|nr:MAG: hypothetical protein GPOALKHO_001488 [Sodalis sp.]